jgi:hypothetical protein
MLCSSGRRNSLGVLITIRNQPPIEMRALQVAVAFLLTFIAVAILLPVCGAIVIDASSLQPEISFTKFLQSVRLTTVLGALALSPLSAVATLVLGCALLAILENPLSWGRGVLFAAAIGTLPGAAVGMVVSNLVCTHPGSGLFRCGVTWATGISSFALAGALSALLFTILSTTRRHIAGAKRDANRASAQVKR